MIVIPVVVPAAATSNDAFDFHGDRGLEATLDDTGASEYLRRLVL